MSWDELRSSYFSVYRRVGRLRAGYELNVYAIPLPRLIARVEDGELALALLVQDKIGDPMFGCSIELRLPLRR